MKKTLCVILAAALLAALAACGGSGQTGAAVESPAASVSPTASAAGNSAYPLDFYKSTQYLEEEQDGKLLCRVGYPALSLSAEDAAAFPALKRTVDALNSDAAVTGQSSYEQLLSLAREEYSRLAVAKDTSGETETGAETGFEAYTRTVTVCLPRADSLAVSVLYCIRTYSGGTEGEYYYSSNINSSTGQTIALGDVVTDMQRFRTALDTALRAEYPKADFSGLEDALNGFLADTSTLTWTLDYQGISFFFAPGTIAPYNEGAFVLSMRFADNLGFLTLKYTVTPSSYAVPLIGGRALNMDVDGDGAADGISAEYIYSDDGGSIEGLEINAYGKSYTANTPMLESDMYLVYAAEGRAYLFVSAQNLTGYGYISVYRLAKNGVTLAGMMYNCSLYGAGYASACPGVPLLTDPDSFMLGTRIQYLGTLTGLKSYSVGADGMPQTGDAYYQLYGGGTLTLKKELALATISATGSGTFSTERFPVGTRFSFLRCDDSGSVDMYTDDGVYCRFYVSGSAGSQYVNGMAVEEVFDGIKY